MKDFEIIEREQNLLVLSNGIKSSDTKTSCRTAYLFDDFVIKFGSGGKTEVLVWNIIEPQDRKYFAEIYGSGEFNGKEYVITERIFFGDVNSMKATEEQLSTLQYLKDKYGLCDMHLDRSCDGEGYDWGYCLNSVIDINGDLKIYDYEMNENIDAYN